MKTRKYKYYKCVEDDVIMYFRKARGSGNLEYLDGNGYWFASMWDIKILKKKMGFRIFEIPEEEWVLIDKH